MKALIVFIKNDLRMFFRMRQALLPAAFFACVTVSVLTFCFGLDGTDNFERLAGILFATELLLMTFLKDWTFAPENGGDQIPWLIKQGQSIEAILLSRFLVVSVVTGIIVVFSAACAFLFYHVPVGKSCRILHVLFSCHFGLTALSIFAASVFNRTNNNLLFSLLFFPFSLPLVLPGIYATSLVSNSSANAVTWITWGLTLAYGLFSMLFSEMVWKHGK